MSNFRMKLVFDRRKTANNTTKCGYLEIYIYDKDNSEKMYLSTGVELFANQFLQPKGERGRVIKHPNIIAINRDIKEIWDEVESFVLSSDCKSLDDIKKWKSKDPEIYSFIQFAKRYQLERAKKISEGTARHHDLLVRRLQDYGKIITFEDINYKNIVGFDVYLRDLGLAEVSLYKPHAILRSYIDEAIRRDKVKSNPYIRFELKRGKSPDPVFLVESEVKAIESLILDKLTDKKIERVRDMFLFQCYTGLSYADMKKFKKSDIYIQDVIRDNKTIKVEVIRSNRKKTDERFIIPILPQARKILEKYDYELPIITNEKYNDYLKLLAAKAELNKNISSHAGRHTFAIYSLNKGVPIESLSAMMGHTKIEMTQHYAKLLGNTVINDALTHIIDKNKKPTKKKK